MCCSQQRAHDWAMQYGHTAANMRSGDNRARKQLLGNCVVRLDWIECVGRGHRLQGGPPASSTTTQHSGYVLYDLEASARGLLQGGMRGR
jgi:hypothetical protein